MQPDHRVGPRDDEDQHLAVALYGRFDEKDPQQIGVIPGIDMEIILAYTRADHVRGEQDWDRETE